MTHDDEQFLKLGREIVRMIGDVRKVARDEPGYARRKFTFPGGEVHVVIANDPRLADLFERAAAAAYRIAEAHASNAEELRWIAIGAGKRSRTAKGASLAMRMSRHTRRALVMRGEPTARIRTEYTANLKHSSASRSTIGRMDRELTTEPPQKTTAIQKQG